MLLFNAICTFGVMVRTFLTERNRLKNEIVTQKLGAGYTTWKEVTNNLVAIHRNKLANKLHRTSPLGTQNLIKEQ